jgi:chromosome segregation ATPase
MNNYTECGDQRPSRPNSAREATRDAASALSQLESATRLTRVALLQLRGQLDQHEATCLDLRDYLESIARQTEPGQRQVEGARRHTATAWEQLQAQASAHTTSRRRMIATDRQLRQSEQQLARLQETIERLMRETS